jgi:hypothetical protein
MSTITRTLVRASVGVLAAAMSIGLAAPTSAATPVDAVTVAAAATTAIPMGPTARSSGPNAPDQQNTDLTVVFEVFGSGLASVVTNPYIRVNGSKVQLPFRKEMRVGAKARRLEVDAFGPGAKNATCRITIDGNVVMRNTAGPRCVVVTAYGK